METTAPHRAIKSFVLRQEGVIRRRKKPWENLWPVFGIEAADIDWTAPSLFGRIAPITLEIRLWQWRFARQRKWLPPQQNATSSVSKCIPPVWGHLLKLVGEQGLQNVRVMNSMPSKFCKSVFRQAHWIGCNCFPQPVAQEEAQ